MPAGQVTMWVTRQPSQVSALRLVPAALSRCEQVYLWRRFAGSGLGATQSRPGTESVRTYSRRLVSPI